MSKYCGTVRIFSIPFIAVFFFVLLQFSLSFAMESDMSIAIDSRIKTFVYTTNQVFPIKINYGYQTFIEFSEGEIIKTVAPGDANSWNIVPSGNRIFIKALEKKGRTNLTVITNRRSYIFDLIARDEVDEVDRELTYYIRFFYPEKQYDQEESQQNDIFAASSNNFNSDYDFSGEKSLQPLEVFDNGKITFFKFRKNIPKIFILKNDNVEYASKMVLFGDYIAVNGVHKNITLRYKENFAKLTNLKKK